MYADLLWLCLIVSLVLLSLFPLGTGGGIWVPTNMYFLCRMNKEYILFFYSHLYLFKVYFILMYRSDLKIIETLLWNFMLGYFIINYLIKELSYSQNIGYCFWVYWPKYASKRFEVLRLMRFDM